MSYNYLKSVVDKYTVNHLESRIIEVFNSNIAPIIREWGDVEKNKIVDYLFSGSIAKGTAISLTSDADIFISLSSSNNSSLREIYTTLYDAFSMYGYRPRKQNVSIGINYYDYKIDLVPGKRCNQYSGDHSLFRSKLDTHTKTNVNNHISYVKNSNRIEEIKLVKIWKALHNLDFPSFYLELVVIDALKGCEFDDLLNNFYRVLDFISNELESKKYQDPANLSNVISGDLTSREKNVIANQARISKGKDYWTEVVW